jgi:hypothetical protein
MLRLFSIARCRREEALITSERRVPPSIVPVTDRRVPRYGGASRVDSPVAIITDKERNAKFVSPTHERVSADAQYCFQCIEANAGDRLFPD